MKKRMLITVPTAIMLLALYFIIFGLSAQDGGESGSLSQLISAKCVDLFNSLTGRHWSEVVLEQWTNYFEHPLRKLAHFCEYACMGILVYFLLSQWIQKRIKKRTITIVWIFLSAAMDEFHQFFVPGRYSSIADVFLDTFGGFTGMCLCIVLAYFLKKYVHLQGNLEDEKSAVRKER